jgi:hypothetical protein
MYAAESDGADVGGPYSFKGKINDPENDRWAIDGTVFESQSGGLYFAWSGWADTKEPQNLYIAPMSNPWTVSGPRVLMARPEFGWEGQILEGPQFLQKDGTISIVYSANASWTDDYCLGLLRHKGGDLLDPAAWEKQPSPIFRQFADNRSGVYGPGHASFTQSRDGTEDWIVYHAAKAIGRGWDRNIRMQPFVWREDGTPFLGHPIPATTVLPVPSGEGTPPRWPVGSGRGLKADYFVDSEFAGRAFSRLDPALDFDWDTGSPRVGLPTNGYAVRWQGWIQARYSEACTFAVVADDGVRVWLDGELALDSWIPSGTSERTITRTLSAGEFYPITIEYSDFSGRAEMRMFWTSSNQAREIVPRSQLYPELPPRLRIGADSVGGHLTVTVQARANSRIAIQASRDLKTWNPLLTNDVPVSGRIDFTRDWPPGGDLEFFRATSP